MNSSKLIAQTDKSFVMKSNSLQIQLKFLQNQSTTNIIRDLVHFNENSPFRLKLYLYRIKGNTAFPLIDVHINKNKEFQELKNTEPAGILALYGLETSSHKHPYSTKGQGLDECLDISDALAYASKQSNWSDQEFSITLELFGEIGKDAFLTVDSIELWYVEIDY